MPSRLAPPPPARLSTLFRTGREPRCMPGVVVSAGAQRPGSSAWQEAEAAYGPPLTSNPPHVVWRRDAHPGVSTDVSLRGGAAPRSRLGLGQRYLTWSGEEPKRHPETEQPPPWRVSPSGQLRLLRDGSDSPSPHRSGQASALHACSRPTHSSGSLRVPLLAPLPCPNTSSAEGFLG